MVVVLLLSGFDRQHDWGMSSFANLLGVIPEEVLLVFWNPSLDENIVGVLFRISFKGHLDLGGLTYSIKRVINAVGI
jgi:hypothetical protein